MVRNVFVATEHEGLEPKALRSSIIGLISINIKLQIAFSSLLVPFLLIILPHFVLPLALLWLTMLFKLG